MNIDSYTTDQVIGMCLERGLITLKGSWFTLTGDRTYHGKKSLRDAIEDPSKIVKTFLVNYLEVDQSVIRSLGTEIQDAQNYIVELLDER